MMQRPSTYPTALMAAVLAIAVVTAACGAGSKAAEAAPPGPRSSSPASPASPASPPTSASASPPGPATSPATPAAPGSPTAKSPAGPPLSLPPNPPVGCDDQPWQTVPVHVTRHFAVPSVPVITAIRTGTHPECSYDRIVFNIRGPVPGYDIRYVPKRAAAASAAVRAFPGRWYLLITIHPAQGHSGSGASTIARPSAATGYPVLRGYAVTGDFEGVLSVAIGLATPAAFRVGRLTGRLYVDVAG
jgi:hypothetical protein